MFSVAKKCNPFFGTQEMLFLVKNILQIFFFFLGLFFFMETLSVFQSESKKESGAFTEHASRWGFHYVLSCTCSSTICRSDLISVYLMDGIWTLVVQCENYVGMRFAYRVKNKKPHSA